MEDKRLMPATRGERIEVRRLMAWFNDKFFEEAVEPAGHRAYLQALHERG